MGITFTGLAWGMQQRQPCLAFVSKTKKLCIQAAQPPALPLSPACPIRHILCSPGKAHIGFFQLGCDSGTSPCWDGCQWRGCNHITGKEKIKSANGMVGTVLVPPVNLHFVSSEWSLNSREEEMGPLCELSFSFPGAFSFWGPFSPLINTHNSISLHNSISP